MAVTSAQCIAVMLAILVIRGIERGWHREIITCAVVLAAVFFLTIGGGDALYHLLFTSIPGVFSGQPLNFSLANAPAAPVVFSGLLLIGFAVLAHLGGAQYGSAPKTTPHRLAGAVAGLVSGLALAYYITNRLLPSTTFTEVSPNSTDVGVWVVGLFGLGMLLLLFFAVIRK